MNPFAAKAGWLDAGLFYCAFVWGASFIVVKDLLAQVHPVTLVGHRFLLSALLILPWVWRRKSLGRDLREGIALGALLMILYVTQTAGLLYTSAANSGFITGLFILFVPLFLLLFFRQAPEPGQWLAVGLAMAGLWLLTGGLKGANRGDALTLLAAMTYAGHLLATDRYVRADADPVLLAFHQFWFTGAACLILAWATDAPLGVPSRSAAWVILFLTLIPTLSAFCIQMTAQKHIPPIRVSLIFSLEPVFAALFSWTVGGESFDAFKALGGGMIVAAMVLGELSRLQLIKGRRQEVLPA